MFLVLAANHSNSKIASFWKMAGSFLFKVKFDPHTKRKKSNVVRAAEFDKDIIIDNPNEHFMVS